MKSSVVAITALPLLRPLVNRNDQLNEKAYQRALARNNRLQTSKGNALYSILVFEPSENILSQQLTDEKKARQRILDMQKQMNEVDVHSYELALS